MVETTLVASAVFALASAVVYAFVGRRLAQRKVSEEARLAATAFSVWWYALAGLTAVGAFQQLAAAAGYTSLPVTLTFTLVTLLGLCIGLWGLLYYLLFLFTGRRSIFAPLTVFYIAYYVFVTYYVIASDPSDVLVNRWNVTLKYASQIQGPVFTALVVGLLFPQILGALAYFTLYFKVKERTQKYRIAIVSWSIVLWFGSAFVAASLPNVSQSDGWQLASKFLGLGAALAVFFAYHPPGFVRRRWQVASVAEEHTAPPSAGQERAGAVAQRPGSEELDKPRLRGALLDARRSRA